MNPLLFFFLVAGCGIILGAVLQSLTPNSWGKDKIKKLERELEDTKRDLVYYERQWYASQPKQKIVNTTSEFGPLLQRNAE